MPHIFAAVILAGNSSDFKRACRFQQVCYRACYLKSYTCNVNREQTLIEVNLTDADEENADFTHFFAEFPLSSVFANFDMFNKISENLRSDL